MTNDTLDALRGLIAADSALLKTEADLKRARAADASDPLEAARLHGEAEGLGRLATQLLDPATFGMPELVPGRGGEVMPLPDKEMPPALRDVAEVVASRSEVLASEGSLARLNRAQEAGVLTEAVDAADSVGAENAVEQMLAHEIAAAHGLGMRLIGTAEQALQRGRLPTEEGRRSLNDANRTVLTAARLMDSVTRAASALDRMRNGGRQQVTVHHLTVADGGQAVVAGNVETGSARGAKRTRNKGRGVQ